MNKFQFMGRLTRDPETRVLPNSSTNVTTFSLAVNRRFADANGERKTDFFNVTAFGRLADFCGKYYKKGQQVLVEGRIQNRSWDDQNGQKRYVTEVIANSVEFLGSKNSNSTSSNNDNSGEPTPYDFKDEQAETTNVENNPFADFGENIEISDDELPF